MQCHFNTLSDVSERLNDPRESNITIDFINKKKQKYNARRIYESEQTRVISLFFPLF